MANTMTTVYKRHFIVNEWEKSDNSMSQDLHVARIHVYRSPKHLHVHSDVWTFMETNLYIHESLLFKTSLFNIYNISLIHYQTSFFNIYF